MFRCYFTFLLSLFLSHSSLLAQNSLSGQVIMPKSKGSVFKVGGIGNYEEEGLMSVQKKRIIKENHPDRNVVISLHPLSFEPSTKAMDKVVLTQKEKTFIPHVLPITQGSVVYILNEDEFYHNVHSKKPHGLFNIGRKKAGVGVPVTIDRLGLIRVGCNEHSEMKGFILSLDTPYFTKADANGNYELPDLPDGRYQIKVFHPRMKRPKVMDQIELKNGKALKKKINLSRP